MNKSLQMVSWFTGVILGLVVLLFGGLNLTQNRKAALGYPQYTTFWLDSAVKYIESEQSAGTKQYPYLINTPAQLAYIAKAVNGGTVDNEGNVQYLDFSGVFFQLNADIDLSGSNWVPIGNEAHPFKGVFYGNGKKISNMVIDSTMMNATAGGVVVNDFRQSLGLFGYVGYNGSAGETASTINQLVIENAYINACEYAQYAGTVAGVFEGASLNNITIISPTSETSNDTTSAGAVIYHNLTDASVMSADFIAGGVVGKLGNSTSTTVANLSNSTHDNEILTSIKSTIYDNNGYSVVLGGLVGENNGTLKESRRTGGEINAFIGTIGGLVGVNSASAQVLDCYNYGNILIDPLLPNGVSVDSGLNKAEETVIGGVVGKNYGSISTENFSAFYGTIEGQNVAQVFQTCRGLIGGIAGINRNGTIESITNSAFVKCTGDQVQYMGGITAINAGVIRKCVNKGIVGADGNTEFTAKAVGGITGLNDSASIGDGAEQLGDGKIYGVENKADTGININAENAGGIAGINASTGNITSYEAGAVVGVVRNLGNVQGTTAVGGIVGKNYGTVEYVYNTTNISCASNSDSASVGGVVGIMSKGAIKNSFNVGQVLDGYNVGGFVGTMENRTARIENCINYGSVTGSRGYVGGFAGYIEAGVLSKVIAICDVTANGGSPLGIGGVIGAVKLSSGAPDTGVTLENYFYSESIANYEEDEFGVTDNGMIAIGNTDINKWAKMDSYKMTLPYVESKMTGSDRYRSGLYKAGSTGAEIENTDWYFNTANETANTYYYPILRAFKAGETNSLNVYGATADAVKPENGLEYPSETIFRVEFRNNYPYWNVNAKDYEERVICEDRYVVNGHYTAEPNSDLYDKPAGFYMQWKQTDIDMTTAPQNWSFANKVTRNMRIYIDWAEKTYAIKYYLQLNGVGEFVEMTAEEIEQFGLSDSSTYSLDENAKSSLNAIRVEPKLFGYSFDGWWISKTASGIGATLDEADKVTEFSRNEVYAEDIIYVYGKKTAETYTVYLYPGVNNSNIAMKFVDAQEGTPKVVTLTYGEAFDLSDIQAQLDYDPADITFKGWFSNEGTGGTQYTNTNSVSIGVFKLTGTGAIRWYAQWTDSMQKILFVSIDENGTEQNLGSTSVPFGNIFTYEQFVSQNLKYYVIDERGGYEIDRCFADVSLLTLFDFNNNSITDRTTIYITWKKKFFSLRLNADGGAFSDDSTVYVINNIEYKSDFLGEVLNNLADTQMPARIGYKVKRVNDIAIWNEQPNGQGAVISYANNNYIMPAYDLNIYISWEVEKYTVQIVANGGLFTTENGSTPSINIALEYNTSLKQALDRYFVANALPTNEGYGFRYWSLQNAGIDDAPAPALTDSDKVPYLGTTVYATWGRQYIVKFKKIFYDDETSWLEIKVFEGDCVSEPDTSSTDFMVAGMDFVEWKQYMGTITNENGEKEQIYQAYDWLEPVTSDLILVGTWTPNGGKTNPIDTSNILIIAISIIAGIVVIMFVVILARSRKKGLEVSNKRLQTKNSKEKLEKIREIEERRKNDNPFDF